ncbi:MAG: class I SAM-dependent methyltransferase [Pseudomonadota bacterium]|nr:class I SAM-dependent methyltransferase [Pseudomonadota bacterium]
MTLKSKRALRLIAGLIFFGSMLPALSPASADLYRPIPATADGIGKSYLGRQIAQVMGWQGAQWLEREEREREERGDLLLRELGLKPGMNVMDVGAGTGYYSRRIAELVGPKGKVYAVDVQPEMVAMLDAVAKRPGLGNIQPVLGSDKSVTLPEDVADLAIMVDVYHELEFPSEMLTSIISALRPGGRLVFVEYRAEDPQVPIKPLHKMSEAQIRREAAQNGLIWERTANTLPWQHMVIFKTK